MIAWIQTGDEPELLKTTANGQPAFLVLPQGEDTDEMVFTSMEALRIWTEKLGRLVEYPQDAQPYDEWLEMNS